MNIQNTQTGRLFPQDIFTEEIIISIGLSQPNRFTLICQILDTDDFYKEIHQIIFNSMKRVYSNGNEIDIVNVRNDLLKNGELEKIGGIYKLMELTSMFIGIGDTENYAYRIKDLSIKRKTIFLVHELSNKSYNENTTGIELLSTVIAETEKLYQSSFKLKTESYKDQLKKAVDDIGKSMSGLIGLDTGFSELNKRTNGLQGPDLIVLAAGPGEGKSTLALNIAKHVAKTKGVLFFALEMTSKQLINRIVADANDISVNELKTGKNINGQNIDHLDVWDKLRATQTDDLSIYVYDKEITSVNDITAISKTEKERKDVGLIVVDYLQLVPCGDARAKTRDQEIGVITRALKKLAMQLNVPVLLLSQLNRDKNRKFYKMSDLRESGNIEQDADGVWFIWRPHAHNQDFYKDSEGKDYDCDKEDAFLKIAKFRDGEPCEYRMKFKGNASKFIDLNDSFNQVNQNDFQVNNNDLPF